MAPLACWSITYTSKDLTKWHIQNGAQKPVPSFILLRCYYIQIYQTWQAGKHSAFRAWLDTERRIMFG